MKDFRNLQFWQKAHNMVLKLYSVANDLPAEERFGLTAQMRRVAVSVGSNIAEGAGINSDKDFARFLQMAFASASELEYQVLLSNDLELISEADLVSLNDRIAEVKRMLSSLILMSSLVRRHGYPWVSAAGMLPSSLQGRIYGVPRMSMSANLRST